MLRYLVPLVVVVGVLVFLLSAYTVSEAEQVIVTQFGEPIGAPRTEPGLYFRMPIVQEVRRFDKRILQWDGQPEQIPTREKRYIYIDAMARWQIADPLLFLQSVRDEQGALGRVDAIVNGAVRDVVSSHSLIEVIRSTNRSMQLDLTESPEDVEELDIGNVQRGRDQLCAQILEEAAPLMESVGVRLLDVRIKRLRYVESVLQEVYSRMVSERERIAARYLSEGKGERAKIQGDLERDLKRIESEAFRDAERIRGEADATAAGIYAEAYEQDPEFYGFVKTLDTYREALGSDVTVLLSSQSELFRFLKGELLPE